MSNVESSENTEPRKEPKVIKRYTNRKLYDTEESRYVTLEDISEMIKAGIEVKIVQNNSQKDLTAVTLAQIIFEEEKKRSKMPQGMLRDIIRHSGETLSGFLQSQVSSRMGSRVASLKEEAEGLLRERWMRRESESKPHSEVKPSAIEQAMELWAQSQRVLDEWQKRIDDRVRHTVENVTSLPGLVKELANLKKRVEELERALDEIER